MTQDFFRLIDRMNGAPAADRARVEADIWHTYGVEMAMLALDMSQFSLAVRRGGILPYLGLVRRMQVATAPLVEEAGGKVVKFEADNLMAVFPDVPPAVEAAVRINRALAGESCGGIACAVGVGIDYGRFLMIPGEDCFGDTVNVAYKLGEDVARPGEVLLTSAARARLGRDARYRLVEQRVSISGLDLATYSVTYQGTP
jgi:adenylate cyclase